MLTKSMGRMEPQLSVPVALAASLPPTPQEKTGKVDF
jgi:hypothetical protein